YSTTDDGVIYSRRMLRDAVRSEEGRQWVNKRKDRQATGGADSPANRTPNTNPSSSPSSPPSSPPSTQKPEARSQKLEAKAADVQRDAADEAAIAIMQAFDDVRRDWFPDQGRMPDSTDIVFATRWAKAGADVALCRGVFHAQCERMRATKYGPPRKLKLFDDDV